MPIDMSPNTEGQPPIELDVTVEFDEDIFLSVVGNDPDSGDTRWDYFTTDPSSIDLFFQMTTKAKQEWDRLLEEAGERLFEEKDADEAEESELLVIIPDEEKTEPNNE
jgi:hypothetical protein